MGHCQEINNCTAPIHLQSRKALQYLFPSRAGMPWVSMELVLTGGGYVYTYVLADEALQERLGRKWGQVVAEHMLIQPEEGFSLVAMAGDAPAGVIGVLWQELPQPLAESGRPLSTSSRCKRTFADRALPGSWSGKPWKLPGQLGFTRLGPGAPKIRCRLSPCGGSWASVSAQQKSTPGAKKSGGFM